MTVSVPQLAGDVVGSREGRAVLEGALVWDAHVGGRRRVAAEPLVLSPARHADAVRKASEARSLVFRAGERARTDPALRARYRLAPDVARLAEADTGTRARALTRVDLLLGEDGRFVACEVNADCPGGHNETLALPRLARLGGYRGGFDPTCVVAALADELVALAGGQGSPRGVVAVTYATAWAEDLQVAALVVRAVEARGGRAVRVGFSQLRAKPDGVFVRGERVAVLYRYLPLEYMTGEAMGDLADAIARGQLDVVNPASVIHAQSKLSMACLWEWAPSLAEGIFPETRAFAGMDPERLVRESDAWVLKRDLSRVGDHVIVGAMVGPEAFAAAVRDVVEDEEAGAVWVVQRHVAQEWLPTPRGLELLTLGVYFLGDTFVGYFARLSPTRLCTHDAVVVPVFVEGTSA